MIQIIQLIHFLNNTEAWVDVDSLAIGLALVGKAAVVSCFCTIFIYSNEIFPTVIRTVGVGACAFFGRVGSLLAPQLLLVVRNQIKHSQNKNFFDLLFNFI